MAQGIRMVWRTAHIVGRHLAPLATFLRLCDEFVRQMVKPEAGVVDVDALEPFKMLSNMYRFNSNFIHNPLCLFKSAPDRWKPDENHGAVLQKGAFDPMKVREETAPPPFVADSLKLSYVRKFVNLAKGSRLVFVASPKWYAPVDSLRYLPIKDICREMGVEYLDFTNSSKYIHNNELFVDGVHLNAKGAAEFSRDLMKTLTSKNQGEE